MFQVSRITGEYPAVLIARLNAGPNFLGATGARQGRLPENWRLNFGRISPRPLPGDAPKFEAVNAALRDFELACGQLLNSRDGQSTADQIMAGVKADGKTRQLYVGHRSPFSIRRPDLLITSSGTTICGNDDAPSDIVHAYWLDFVYGVNQRRWSQAFQWLTEDGPLVFAISTRRGRAYLKQIIWFAEHLTARGFPVRVMTQEEVRHFRTSWRGASYNGQKVGAVWRLFSILEADGAFARVVEAAQNDQIRLVPELASWGNKAWMGVFWQQTGSFRYNLGMHPLHFNLLSTAMPYSRTVGILSGFPTGILVNGELVRVADFAALQSLSGDLRNRLVAKTTSVHDQADRSFGALIGPTVEKPDWTRGLHDLLSTGAPLLLQEYRPAEYMQIPVWSVINGRPQLEGSFAGNVLVRPWYMNDRLVSATALVVPAGAASVRRTVAGAEIPLDFG